MHFHLRGHIVALASHRIEGRVCKERCGAMCSAWCKSKIYDLKLGNKQCNNQINKFTTPIDRPFAHFYWFVVVCIEYYDFEMRDASCCARFILKRTHTLKHALHAYSPLTCFGWEFNDKKMIWKTFNLVNIKCIIYSNEWKKKTETKS